MYFSRVKLTIVLAAVLLATSRDVPGQVTGRVYLEKKSYVVGEPLIFTLEIENTGKEAIQLYPPASRRDLGNFSFSMERTSGASPDGHCEASWNLREDSADPVGVKAGGTYTYQWPLDFWYRIEHAGTFKVDISGYLLFSSQKGGLQVVPFSAHLPLYVVTGDPSHVEEVLRRFEADLRSSDYEIQHNALDVLSTTAPSYFHDEIFRLARDEDPFVAIHAVGGLERLNSPDARALLAEIITSRKVSNPDEQDLRCRAIKALGHSGDASYVQWLAPYAEHTNTCESEFAMDAMAQLGRANAVPLLQAFLSSPQAQQRLRAVNALPFTSSPDAVDVLIGALRDKDDSVRSKAASGLVMLTGNSMTGEDQPSPSPLQLENLWLAWWDKHRKEAKVVEIGWDGFCRID